ncbi:MAG: hypothetical protein ABS79_01275 [Planctomycetes bacterium SCN 63-9]|nr:MAG: hypothetical protein ABS79_01275 [Planctomycetes bacterium SCN 63-9]
MTDYPFGEDTEGVWSIVANIKRERPSGPGGVETKFGTRLFRGGTKVYIAGCFPGTCDAVLAIGLHRKSRRFINCVVDVRAVENFRVKMVYHPQVLERIRRHGNCWIRTKEDADTWAAAFPGWQELWERKPTEGSQSQFGVRVQTKLRCEEVTTEGTPDPRVESPANGQSDRQLQ